VADADTAAVDMVIRLGFQSVEKLAMLTERVVVHSISMYLNHRKNNKYNSKNGKQSMKSLKKANKPLEVVQLDDKNDLANLQKEFKKYKVDFSVIRDKETGKLEVWFKGQDSSQISNAMKKIVDKSVKTKEEIYEKNSSEPEKTTKVEEKETQEKASEPDNTAKEKETQIEEPEQEELPQEISIEENIELSPVEKNIEKAKVTLEKEKEKEKEKTVDRSLDLQSLENEEPSFGYE